MKPLTQKQQMVINAIQREGIASVPVIMKTLDLSLKAVKAHVQRLEQDNYIRVIDWVRGANGGAIKVYAVGAGENKPLDRAAFKAKIKQEKARKARTLRNNSYDPFAPVIQNSGWVSKIHSLDYSIHHADHIKFMERFQPRPDVAAAWLANPVEQSINV
jgi:predicted ArsR family transcriptional regulator